MNFNKLTLLYHTVKHLKPVQIYGRLWFRLYHPKPDFTRRPELRPFSDKWVIPIPKPSTLLQPWRFCFLNEEHDCRFPEDWNNGGWSKLWLFNLHYFDDLQSVEEEQKQEWHAILIEKWIEDNTPGIGNGWAPYPLSLRIVNWIKWVLSGNELSCMALQNLAVQTRFLFKRIEFHLLGNHLFTNAKALLYAGIFFQGSEADKWLSRSMKILDRELPEQVLEDGGHFERSPMYHAIILEDMLDLINIMRGYQISVPPMWKKTVVKMLTWLRTICHPDGEIALVNDAAFGIAPSTKTIHEYAYRLGFQKKVLKNQEATRLVDSGYIRCHQGDMMALLDVGAIGSDYLTAHAHADTLSFELSLYGRRVIVDSGTSCYGMSKERDRQRGTLAHNTVAINGCNSSEVWGGFRVARRAKPFNLVVEDTEGKIKVTCSHNGYRRLRGRVIHKREWIFQKGCMLVKDTLTGKFKKAVGRFHFHPDIQLAMFDSNTKGEAVLTGGKKMKWKVISGNSRIVKTSYHPEFGVSIDNWCLEVVFLSQECEVFFKWDDVS